MTEWEIINYSDGKYHWFWQNSEDYIIELIFDSNLIKEAYNGCLTLNNGSIIPKEINVHKFLEIIKEKGEKQFITEKTPSDGDVVFIKATMWEIFTILFLFNSDNEIVKFRDEIAEKAGKENQIPPTLQNKS